MRTSLARFLSEIPINNLESIQQTAGAVLPLLQKPDEITPDAEVRFLFCGNSDGLILIL